jgi:hypothetical protein
MLASDGCTFLGTEPRVRTSRISDKSCESSRLNGLIVDDRLIISSSRNLVVASCLPIVLSGRACPSNFEQVY